MPMKDDIINGTVEHFQQLRNLIPSEIDIRLASYDIADYLINHKNYSKAQYKRININKLVNSIKIKLKNSQ